MKSTNNKGFSFAEIMASISIVTILWVDVTDIADDKSFIEVLVQDDVKGIVNYARNSSTDITIKFKITPKIYKDDNGNAPYLPDK